MPFDDALIHVVGIALALAAFLIFVAYLMAAYGEFNDTHFGRAVFYTAIPASVIAGLVHQFAPDLLRDLNITPMELVLFATGAVALAGVCGAVLDAVSWLRGS